MLEDEIEYCPPKGNELSVNTANYIVHESGTAVYDRLGRYVGNFATEMEAVEMVREISKSYFDR